MAYLKAYQWEAEKYPQFRKVSLCSHDQRKIIKKLAKHFKVSEPYVMNTRTKSGSYGHSAIFGARIKLNKEPSLALVCHEFAHHLEKMKYSDTGHSKRFKKELKKVYTFAKRYLPKVEIDDKKAVEGL